MTDEWAREMTAEAVAVTSAVVASAHVENAAVQAVQLTSAVVATAPVENAAVQAVQLRSAVVAPPTSTYSSTPFKNQILICRPLTMYSVNTSCFVGTAT